MKTYDDELKKLNDKIKDLNTRVTKLENNPKLETSSSLDMNIAKNLKTLKPPN